MHCRLLINVLVQYAGKVLGRTQSSLLDVYFGFTKSVLISQEDQLKILILVVEGVFGNAFSIDG